MHQIDQNILHFLQQQIDWHKEQDCILEKIEGKLKAMKGLVQYRLEHEMTYNEVQNLNNELNYLKVEVVKLEQALYKGTTVH